MSPATITLIIKHDRWDEAAMEAANRELDLAANDEAGITIEPGP